MLEALVVASILWINTHTPYNISRDEVVVHQIPEVKLCVRVLHVSYALNCFLPRNYYLYGTYEEGNLYINRQLRMKDINAQGTILHELIHHGQAKKRNDLRWWIKNRTHEDKEKERLCREMEAVYYEYLYSRDKHGYDPDATLYDNFIALDTTTPAVFIHYITNCSLTEVNTRFHTEPFSPNVGAKEKGKTDD